MTRVHLLVFSAPMVRALLDGRKTQTRRLPRNLSKDGDCWRLGTRNAAQVFMNDDQLRKHGPSSEFCPYAPGDLIWVRETWGIPLSIRDAVLQQTRRDCVVYRVDLRLPPSYDDYSWPIEGGKAAWRSPIHMPRWASRLTLEVRDVRVQRLQEISEEDAIAEGIEQFSSDFGRGWGIYDHGILPTGEPGWLTRNPLKSFATLWDSLHKRGERWADDPWVVALSFCVHRANVDDVLRERAA